MPLCVEQRHKMPAAVLCGGFLRAKPDGFLNGSGHIIQSDFFHHCSISFRFRPPLN
jgi:hypothetical protein